MRPRRVEFLSPLLLALVRLAATASSLWWIASPGVRSPAATMLPSTATAKGAAVLILAILVFGMLIGWLAQLALGMGTKPNAQSLIAGLVGSFVGGLVVSLIAGDG